MKIKTHDIVMTALFSALIAAGAFIKIPIPNCPITLQTFFTCLAGILLGSKKGAVSVLCYVVLGLAGVPIFTSGGGIGYIFRPTFGYLIGFCFGTFITGKIAEGSKESVPSLKRLIAANFAGLAIVYALGMAYYYIIMNFYAGTGTTVKALFWYCFVLVIPGDTISCIVAAVLGRRLLPILKKIPVY